MKLNAKILSPALVVALLVIDQVIKIAVKMNMCLGDHIEITSWFYINFIENIGMAWGMTFFNKLALSLFRIVAISFIAVYLWRVVKRQYRLSYVLCLSMILAGAMGNLLDSMFYGLVFTASTPWSVSTLVPIGEGYAPFLMGKVVDMFYFPLIHTTWPEWMPFVGGDEFLFFAPVFNFADSCITVGMILLLLFFRKELEDLTGMMSFKKHGKNATAAQKEASETSSGQQEK